VTGPAALIAFIHLLKKSLPHIGRQHLWGFPLFRIFLFALPVDNSGEKGNAVGRGGAGTVGLFSPLHAATHGGCLQFAAGDGFAGEAFGLFHSLFFRFRRPVVPRFTKGGVFAREVNCGDIFGGKGFRNGIFALGNVEVDHAWVFIVAVDKTDDFLALGQFESDVAPVVESGLKGVAPSLIAGARESGAFD